MILKSQQNRTELVTRPDCPQPEVLRLQPARQQRGLAVCDWQDSGPRPLGRPHQGDQGAAVGHPARGRVEGQENGSQAGEGQVKCAILKALKSEEDMTPKLLWVESILFHFLV